MGKSHRPFLFTTTATTKMGKKETPESEKKRRVVSVSPDRGKSRKKDQHPAEREWANACAQAKNKRGKNFPKNWTKNGVQVYNIARVIRWNEILLTVAVPFSFVFMDKVTRRNKRATRQSRCCCWELENFPASCKVHAEANTFSSQTNKGQKTTTAGCCCCVVFSCCANQTSNAILLLLFSSPDKTTTTKQNVETELTDVWREWADRIGHIVSSFHLENGQKKMKLFNWPIKWKTRRHVSNLILI